MRDTSRTLLDSGVNPDTVDAIRRAMESESPDRVADLHIWRVGTSHLSAIVSIVTPSPKPPEHYRRLLAGFEDLSHISVEANRCES